MPEDTLSVPREGEVIAGKFRVERVLGVGGMGVVVAALHMELDQRVALKFLLPRAAHDSNVAARFAREARAAAKIHCEHVARVLDVGTLPDGAPYMVMEYMDGQDLQQVLRRYGPMPFDLATTYILQAAEAIAEAHALGIVHRDLKPANLFLAKRPNGEAIVKVLDFGISKSTLATSEAQLTKTSAAMGSPLYMSPEQMTAAKSVDTRSDIWALGVVLYELLCGVTPFPADTMPELVAAVLQRTHDPVATIRPDVPPVLEAAIQRCLEKSPAARFQNVAEFAMAIAPFARGGDVSVQRITHVLSASGQVIAPVASSGGSLPFGPSGHAATHAPWAQSYSGAIPAQRSSRLPFVVGGIVFVIALGLGMAFFLMRAPPAAEVAGAAVPLPLPSSPPPLPAASTAPVVQASASANASASTAQPAASVAAAPAATVVTPPAPVAPAHRDTKRAAAPAAAPSKPSAAPAADPCKMTSYIDEEGNKRWKNPCQ